VEPTPLREPQKCNGWEPIMLLHDYGQFGASFTAEIQMKSVNLQKLMMSRVKATESDSDGIWDAGVVFPNLFVGSLNAAQNIAMLRSHNITTVLTIANGLLLTLPDGINHIVIEIPDHPIADILSIVEVTISSIDRVLSNPDSGTAGVLVHCASGISRSVSICCAWLMLRQSMSFVDSLEKIRTNRPLANPNVGFHAQLTTLSSTIDKKPGASAKHLIMLAQAEYLQQLGGQTIMDALFEQRETANTLHADADGTSTLIS